MFRQDELTYAEANGSKCGGNKTVKSFLSVWRGNATVTINLDSRRQKVMRQDLENKFNELQMKLNRKSFCHRKINVISKKSC